MYIISHFLSQMITHRPCRAPEFSHGVAYKLYLFFPTKLTTVLHVLVNNEYFCLLMLYIMIYLRDSTIREKKNN